MTSIKSLYFALIFSIVTITTATAGNNTTNLAIAPHPAVADTIEGVFENSEDMDSENEKGILDIENNLELEETNSTMGEVAFYDEAPILDKTVCDLTIDFDLKIEGLQVEFVNKSTGDYSNVEWIFGDGIISNNPDGAHTYQQSGVYNFVVTIYDDNNGCIDYFSGQYFIGKQSNQNSFSKNDLHIGKIANLIQAKK